MTFAPNTSIGHYEVISLLGKGGMGEVYLASDSRLDRKVAIKFLSEEFSSDSDKLNRFIREAKSASALNHPNILTVFEVGEFEGSNYIVTEHIVGRTLNSVLKSEPQTLSKTIDFAIQISSALAAAHDAGIIHRDIKSGNVMVRDDGIVKLLDFGLAKLTAPPQHEEADLEAATIAQSATLPGMLLGTPSYMSPEQARGQTLDARTDIFSFGILFYEMLTGRRPFDGESFADVMGAILKDEPPPLSRIIDDVPPELEHIISKTLRKDRDQRYQNIKDLIIDLRDLKDNLKFEAKLIHTSNATRENYIHSTESPKPPETVAQTVEQSKPRQNPAVYIGAAVLILLAVAGIYYFSTSPEKMAAVVPGNLQKTEIVSWNSAPGELFSTGSFSPDGKLIAYSSTKSGGKNIWIKQTTSGAPVQITKDEFNNQNPVWSPDGGEIAYFSERGSSIDGSGSSTGIWRIPSLGGTSVPIAQVKDGSSQIRSWAPSGKIYYESNGELYSVEVASGNSEEITDLSKDDKTVHALSISDDEKKIAYIRGEGVNSAIVVSELGGDIIREFEIGDVGTGNIVWHPDNERILFSRIVNGVFQIFSADTSSAQPIQISFGESDNAVMDVSSDGGSILTGSAKEDSNLWKVGTQNSAEETVASSIDSELWATVSPADGKVAYQLIKNLSQGNNLLAGDILVISSGSQTPPMQIAQNGFLPSWSPDGSRLAFMRLEDSSPGIWVVRSTGGSEEKLTHGGIPSIGYSVSPYNRIQTFEYSWSPDGNTIAYISDRSGAPNIWTAAADGSGDSQLTLLTAKDRLVSCPIWSPDGKRLAYSYKFTGTSPNKAGKIGISIFDTESKEDRTIFEYAGTFRLIGWSENGNEVIFAVPSKTSVLPDAVELRSAAIDTGKTALIKKLADAYYYNIFLSADRNYVAYAANRDQRDNVWTIPARGGTEQKITNNNDSNLYFSSLTWKPDSTAIYFGKQTRYSLISMLTNFK